MIRDLNNRLALHIAAAFSTMACFWACNALAFLPIVWPQSLDVVQFISSGWLQLVALPVLGVTSAIESAKVMRLLMELHTETQQMHRETHALLEGLHLKIDGEGVLDGR